MEDYRIVKNASLLFLLVIVLLVFLKPEVFRNPRRKKVAYFVTIFASIFAFYFALYQELAWVCQSLKIIWHLIYIRPISLICLNGVHVRLQELDMGRIGQFSPRNSSQNAPNYPSRPEGLTWQEIQCCCGKHIWIHWREWLPEWKKKWPEWPIYSC